MYSSFRDLVETLSNLAEEETPLCPICDENPCVCDDHLKNVNNSGDNSEEIEETVSPQVMAKTLSDPQELPYAIRVFMKLRGGDAQNLNNDERLEAARLLKMIIPTISEDAFFERIKNDLVAREKASGVVPQGNAASPEQKAQQQTTVQQVPEA